MDSTSYVTYLARAVAFLSRLPVPSKYFDGDDGKLGDVSGLFVAAGCLIALPAGLTAVILSASGANNLLIIAITLAIQTLITGALHEDGLSDCADGLWGSSNRARMLEIMHDSRLGTYGTLTLIFAFLLKFTSLYLVLEHTSSLTFLLIFLTAAGLSRGAMIWHWRQLPPARKDGVAVTVGQPSDKAFNTIKISAIIVLGLLVFVRINLVDLSFAVIVTSFSIYAFTRWVNMKIDGHTGDTIGATQQISETVFLVTIALWMN